MKKQRVAPLCLAVGIALGAGVVEGLHAQATPPVFQVGLQKITDLDALTKEYNPLARPTVIAHGGKALAAGVPVVLDGVALDGYRVVINQWDSIDQLRGWFASPEYQKAREIGNKYATFQIFAVTGVPPK